MPVPSGYQPLIDYLAGCEDTPLTLPTERIEEIIDAALPPSAYNVPGWWTHPSSTLVRLMRPMGWRARYDPRCRRSVCID